ncbi:MAG: L-alanine-DL-glutamate epimerase [Gemmatimonadota bacterium]|nr:L-alanine-DL-glutamate epimerase [Gemmatimonadota bacterium]
MRIVRADLEIQRQPFARPFAFKGSAFHEKWNLIVRLTDEDGTEAVGVGGTAVLWSDPGVFSNHTEVGGNILMAALLEFALQQVTDREFTNPPDLLAELVPLVHDYGKTVTRNPDLRLTFSLIALVALDNAAWMLHAKRRGIATFDRLIPHGYRPFLEERQSRLGLAPAVGYGMPMDELRTILDTGVYILKIKIGQPGAEDDMVRKDVDWLERIHRVAAGYNTPMTDSGSVLYYLDANARYGKKESMARLLDHALKTAIHEHIVLIEEPFAVPDEFDVGDLPARFAADESVQTVEDVYTRANQGYGAIAIKPAGKTLSLAFQMVRAAAEAGVPSFVADNGCIPLLVEWNKNVAARLPGFPGIRGGMIESNGPENYANWDEMLNAYPIPDAPWLTPESGAFVLDEDYYRHSGGIFLDPAPYSGMFRTIS